MQQVIIVEKGRANVDGTEPYQLLLEGWEIKTQSLFFVPVSSQEQFYQKPLFPIGGVDQNQRLDVLRAKMNFDYCG